MTAPTAPVEIPVRFDFDALAPSVSAAVTRLHKAAAADLAKAGVEQGLIELIRLRASQLNGCAYCVDMHSVDARAADVSPQRVCLAWMLTKAPVVIPIPGSTRPETIRDSAAAPDLQLSESELRRLDAR